MAPVSKTSAQARPANEVPYTLDAPVPRVLSFWDQSAFWANLGVSLLAFTGAYTVLAPDGAGRPQLSIAAGIVAMIVGTLVGALMLGLAAVPGARTGAPAMVLLRGLFGTRLSYLPTVLNIAQLIGWGTFELIVIAGAAAEVLAEGPEWLHAPRAVLVVAAGLLTTLLTIWPLGSVRLLRRFVTVAVVIALGYFYLQFLRQGVPDLGRGSWSKFWVGADAALAVSISWVPVVADYTRHSRSTKAAFGAAAIGYSATQIVAYVLGLLALAMATTGTLYAPFLNVALGALFLGVFVLREVDQSFANVYSTAVSIQNLFPRWDRRILTVALGTVITVAALLLGDMDGYFGFLGLIGSVFVPMLGVLVADFFILGRGRDWNLAKAAPSRWGTTAAWAVGFAAYQLIRPSGIGWWSDGWTGLARLLRFTPADWMSASLLSFAVAVVATIVIGLPGRRAR